MLKLTVLELVTIMGESYTARTIVANLVVNGVYSPLVDKIKTIVRENGTDKIAAIKAVRDLATSKEIYPLFPLEWNRGGNDNGPLGLVDVKRLVEHVAHTIGRPYPTYQ